jgi:hypothetical protein
MVRRRFVALLVLLLSMLVPAVATAGSYLDRAALLLDASRAERDMVRPRVRDKELVELAYDIARARSDSAGRMRVPEVVAPAHPHLLLVLENTEQAFSAALAGDLQKFVDHIRRARDEDSTFRAIITKLGYSLPTTAHGR